MSWGGGLDGGGWCGGLDPALAPAGPAGLKLGGTGSGERGAGRGEGGRYPQDQPLAGLICSLTTRQGPPGENWPAGSLHLEDVLAHVLKTKTRLCYNGILFPEIVFYGTSTPNISELVSTWKINTQCLARAASYRNSGF